MAITYRKIAEVNIEDDEQLKGYINAKPTPENMAILAEALRSRSDQVGPIISIFPIPECETEVLLGNDSGYYILTYTKNSYAALIEIIDW